MRVARVVAGLDGDDLLGAGHDLGDPALEVVLGLLHEGEAEALARHLADHLVVDLRLVVAQDDGAIGAEHVDVVVAVHVDDVPAVASVDVDRVLALDEVVGPPDAHDAAGGEALGLLEEGHGLIEPQLRILSSSHTASYATSFKN